MKGLAPCRILERKAEVGAIRADGRKCVLGRNGWSVRIKRAKVADTNSII